MILIQSWFQRSFAIIFLVLILYFLLFPVWIMAMPDFHVETPKIEPAQVETKTKVEPVQMKDIGACLWIGSAIYLNRNGIRRGLSKTWGWIIDTGTRTKDKILPVRLVAVL